jgi:hypothetical protein
LDKRDRLIEFYHCNNEFEGREQKNATQFPTCIVHPEILHPRVGTGGTLQLIMIVVSAFHWPKENNVSAHQTTSHKGHAANLIQREAVIATIDNMARVQTGEQWQWTTDRSRFFPFALSCVICVVSGTVWGMISEVGRDGGYSSRCFTVGAGVLYVGPILC